MQQILSISDYVNQTQTIVLPNGNTFTFTLYYVPLQYGWFITNLTYGSFILNSIRVTNNPNMLLQWQNLIPFGLACFSTSLREPSQQEDFVSGASSLWVLTQVECEAYQAYLNGGPLPA